MDSKFYFLDTLNIQPIYIAEDVFHKPFWEFMHRFQSLHRNWVIFKEFNVKHISRLKEAKNATSQSAEYLDLYSEIAETDIEYFPIHLRGYIIAFSISCLENLLQNLSEEVASDLDVIIELDSRPLPYINKYILWLTRGCGLEISISKENNKKLNAIRAIRNRFIHNISRDIPNDVIKTIGKMINVDIHESDSISDAFVDQSLIEISNLVKKIELAYIKFYDKLKCKS